MKQIIFLNGQFHPLAEARVSPFDRGFLFGDGVYEVSAVIDGELIDNESHLSRLERSLKEIRIQSPYSLPDWITFQRELIRRSGVSEGLVYIQVTRGVAERDFAFPRDAAPTVLMFCQHKPVLDAPVIRSGATVVTVPDLRWERRDIKSISLIAQVLAKEAAVSAGATEAWMVQAGHVTEGSSSTAFIVTQRAEIVSRPLSTAILPGITRKAILTLANEHRITVVERPFTVEEACEAREAFYTSATSLVTPVVSIDARPIGNKLPGPIVSRLRELYIAFARSRTRQ